MFVRSALPIGNRTETFPGDATKMEGQRESSNGSTTGRDRSHPPLAGFTVAITADRHWEETADLLRGRGAIVVHAPTVRTVVAERGGSATPSWDAPADLRPALRLVRAIVERRVHVITFTNAVAVVNLFEIATGESMGDDVREAMRADVAVLCLGSRTVIAVEVAGVALSPEPVDACSPTGFVDAITLQLDGRRAMIGELCLSGTAFLVGTERIDLSAMESSLLFALARRPGAVVSKSALVALVWRRGGDEHLVEVTVARLRRRLGCWAEMVEAVPRRGYRIRVPGHCV